MKHWLGYDEENTEIRQEKGLARTDNDSQEQKNIVLNSLLPKSPRRTTMKQSEGHATRVPETE